MAQDLKVQGQKEKQEKVGKISLSATSPTLKAVVEKLADEKAMRGAGFSSNKKFFLKAGEKFDLDRGALEEFFKAQILIAMSNSERRDMIDIYLSIRRGDYVLHLREPNACSPYGGKSRVLDKIGENKYSTIVEYHENKIISGLSPIQKYGLEFTVNDNNTLTITAFYDIDASKRREGEAKSKATPKAK